MSIAFERAKKTFLGFLQARGKAVNTIKNYACDLDELQSFCEDRTLNFLKLGLSDLENYHKALLSRGLKANSRRRKLMTAKTFIRYLSGRIDITTVGAEKIIPPEKVEKPPRLVPRSTVLNIIQGQPNTDWGWRNRALVGVLLDSGMLVTEALTLRIDDCQFDKSYDKTGASISIHGKRARSARVTPMTAVALKELSKRLKEKSKKGVRYLFYGHSKTGPKSERLSARGVEVLFKTWSKTYDARHLHPRTLRHLFVVDCLLKGVSEVEVMRLIALKTPYAFRVYRPLIESLQAKSQTKSKPISKIETTCTDEKNPSEEVSRP